MDEASFKLIKKTIIDFFNEKGILIEKIVLFGSYARNDFIEDSDIDLIILSNEFADKNIFEKAKMTGDLEWQLIKKFKVPFDIMYYSPEEWENSTSLIISEARKSALYLHS